MKAYRLVIHTVKDNYKLGEIRMIRINKNQVFLVKGTKVMSTDNIYIPENEQGYFILNFWEQCSYSDINVLPVAFVRCEGEKELYNIRKTNIILGDEKDICLI